MDNQTREIMVRGVFSSDKEVDDLTFTDEFIRQVEECGWFFGGRTGKREGWGLDQWGRPHHSYLIDGCLEVQEDVDLEECQETLVVLMRYLGYDLEEAQFNYYWD